MDWKEIKERDSYGWDAAVRTFTSASLYLSGVEVAVNGLASYSEIQENHNKAFEHMLSTVDQPVTKEWIRQMNALCVGTTGRAPGMYAVDRNAVEIDNALEYWIKYYVARDHSDIAVHAAQSYGMFVAIHPFQNANDILARILMCRLCLIRDGSFPLIQRVVKQENDAALVEYVNHTRLQPLINLVRESMIHWGGTFKASIGTDKQSEIKNIEK